MNRCKYCHGPTKDNICDTCLPNVAWCAVCGQDVIEGHGYCFACQQRMDDDQRFIDEFIAQDEAEEEENCA